MSSITVRFEGICTHITYPYPPAPDLPHRVVLPRAWGNYAEHVAMLFIPVAAATEEAVREFADFAGMRYDHVDDDNHHVWLEGVTLSIADVVGPYEQQGTFLCGIPRLSGLTRTWLGEPDLAVTNGRKIADAWAYFDVTAGTWSAGTVHDGASAAVLDCDTPAEPMLRAASFDQTMPVLKSLTLAPACTLTLRHVAAQNDRDDDFGIHYRVVRAARRPHNPGGPAQPAPCILPKLPPTAPIPPDQSIGPGCSNSLFP
ncbi:MAG TPA: hypothetical protein VEK57_25360 [Thermoanaerobaculia bacterium]|nr:hypothetical protein [Thermoanaerobaculia bacterium]